MLNLKTLLAALAGILLLTVGSVRANFIVSQLSSTAENEIHDSSLELANTPTIGVGTVISGVVLFTQIGQTGNLHDISTLFPNGEVTAVFSLTVTSVTPNVPGVGNVLTFAPSPTFEAVYGTGAMAAIFENDTGHPLTDQYAAGGGTASTYFADAQAGTLNAVLGFNGTGAETWTGTASNLTFPPVTGLSGEYNGNIDLLPSPSGTYGADTLGAQKILYNEPNPLPPPTGVTQFFVHGDQKFNQNFTGATPPGNSPFAVADDSSLFFYAQVVPEPSTCVLFSMGSVMLMFLRKRRNKAVV